MVTPVEGFAIGSSLVAGFGSLFAGSAQSASLKGQAQAAELDAKISALRAKQVAGQRTEELNDVLSAINSIRSARRVGLDSATGRAIRDDRRRKGKEQRNSDVLTELMGRDRSRARASSLRSQARVAPVMGFVSALGDLSQAASDADAAGVFG
ncbi:MAG: hypothetical protein AAGK93_00475 [Pseudomonadota bacterium]